jgi:hypothetical protein
MKKPKTPAPQPTVDQARAIVAFANENGRTWKDKLRSAWLTASARIHGEHSPYLQQVRNTLGPSWLNSCTLDEVQAIADTTTPEDLKITELLAARDAAAACVAGTHPGCPGV